MDAKGRGQLMPNFILGLDTSQAFKKMDVGTNLITTPSQPPSASGSLAQPAWDGAKCYILGSDGKLYAYTLGTDTWSAALAGGMVFTATTRYFLHSDGQFVYINCGGFFYAYDIIADNVVNLGAFTEGFLVWDYGRTIYSLSGNLTVDKMDLGTRVIHRSYTVNNYPVVGGRNNTFQGAMWTNGKLFVYTGAGTAGSPGMMATGTENGSSLTFGTPTNYTEEQAQQWGTAVAPTTLYCKTFQGGRELAIINTLTPSQATASITDLLFAIVYTSTIQTAFQFLEADGVTPMASVESLIGTAYAYPTQQIGPTEYTLKCVYPRSSVILAVAQDVTNPLSEVLQIATQQAGPYSTSLNMGQFTTNQAKSFWLKATVPSGFSPGVFFASLTATAS